MARKALDQQGCWGWWDGAGPPLWRLAAWVRRGGIQRSGWGEPLVPAEREGTVDQGLVTADGAVGADLEVGPAEFVLGLFVALLDPRPQSVEADDFGEVGPRVRAGGVECVGVGQVGGQVPGGLLRQTDRVGGRHDQLAGQVGAVAAQAGIGGPPGLGVPVAEVALHGCPVAGWSAFFQVRAWAASMGVCGRPAGAQVPRCGLRATT